MRETRDILSPTPLPVEERGQFMVCHPATPTFARTVTFVMLSPANALTRHIVTPGSASTLCGTAIRNPWSYRPTRARLSTVCRRCRTSLPDGMVGYAIIDPSGN